MGAPITGATNRGSICMASAMMRITPSSRFSTRWPRTNSRWEIDPVGRAGDQSAQVLPLHYFQQGDVIRLHHMDLVHLVGQGFVQHPQGEDIPLGKLSRSVNSRAEGRPRWPEITQWVLSPPTGREDPSMWPTATCSTSSLVPW